MDECTPLVAGDNGYTACAGACLSHELQGPPLTSAARCTFTAVNSTYHTCTCLYRAILNSANFSDGFPEFLGRGLHSFPFPLNLRTFGNTLLTLELNLSTFGPRPRDNLVCGGKSELKLDGNGQSKLKLSGNGNECISPCSWPAASAGPWRTR